MKKNSVPSNVASALENKLEAVIRENIGHDVTFNALVEKEENGLWYQLYCDVTVDYIPSPRNFDDPPQEGRINVACDTYDLIIMDTESGDVNTNTEVAERIILNVINSI